ncbi:GH25 family lysozyme [Laceyella putida]|uniref:GH25 family lysozyme n=1 Tax=Laceyella putida TaxID=110101 RepID=A0ABW2RJ86_9BACL
MRPTSRYLLIGSVLAIILVALEYYGFIWHNGLFALPYEVKGLDVSHHQGDIDWEKVKDDDFRFVFIKATEGRDFIDQRFGKNWQQAKEQGFLVGAYHFFSMGSTGKQQAAHFIRTVPKQADSLPPVIDVEIHLNHDQRKVRQELLALAQQLEQHYGKKPILYVTYDTYNQYVKHAFPQYPIWIRDIKKFPTLQDRDWLFWQYSNRGRVNGIDTYVDINVFNGDQNEFSQQFSLRRLESSPS